MSDHESPMLKSSRQTSDAYAYGYNTSGTMAGQVGADAAQRERNAHSVHAAPVRSTGGYSGGGRVSSGGGSTDFTFGDFVRVSLFLLVLGWLFGPPLLRWTADRLTELGTALLGWAPDIAGYLGVIALSLLAMFAFSFMTRVTIILATGLWLGALGLMVFLLLRWFAPYGAFFWVGAAVWSFPVYASLFSVLTLPLFYGAFSRLDLDDNLRVSFLIFLAPGGALSLALIGGGFGLGHPAIIIPGLIVIVSGSALIGGLSAAISIATHFVRIAQDD